MCETLLHDVPVSGGMVMSESVDRLVAGKLSVRRDLVLAQFLGFGLKRLGVEPDQLTSAPRSAYGRTVRWAQAAHRHGCDGVVWMSKRCNNARAYVLFGDRLGANDLEPCNDYARMFAVDPDRAWLVDFCGALHVDVLPP